MKIWPPDPAKTVPSSSETASPVMGPINEPSFRSPGPLFPHRSSRFPVAARALANALHSGGLEGMAGNPNFRLTYSVGDFLSEAFEDDEALAPLMAVSPDESRQAVLLSSRILLIAL